jgi:hypothetical protein
VRRWNGTSWSAVATGTVRSFWGLGGTRERLWVVGDNGTILKKEL